MKCNYITILLSIILSCCTTLDSDENTDTEYTNSMKRNGTSTESLQSSLKFQKHFKSKMVNNQATRSIKLKNKSSSSGKPLNTQRYTNPAEHNINFYAEGLMAELMSNLTHINDKTPIAVASFVMLDSDYNQSTLLGNQIAESMIHQVHKQGISVIDYKTTGYIRVTEQGDFAFSKDFEDFETDLPAQFVLGGTMLKHKEGFLVNARIIDFTTKSVVATAQNFIPSDIVEAMVNQSHTSHAPMKEVTPIKSNTVQLTGN